MEKAHRLVLDQTDLEHAVIAAERLRQLRAPPGFVAALARLTRSRPRPAGPPRLRQGARLEEMRDRGGDVLSRREVRALERPEGHRNIGTGDAGDRRQKTRLALSRDDARDVGPPPAGQRVLLDEDETTGPRDGSQHGRAIPWPHCAEVDDLAGDRVPYLIRGSERDPHHLPETHDRDVASRTRDLRLAQSPAHGAGLEVLLHAVEIPRLEEDHRVVATDRRAQQRVRARGPRRRDDGEPRGVHEP